MIATVRRPRGALLRAVARAPAVLGVVRHQFASQFSPCSELSHLGNRVTPQGHEASNVCRLAEHLAG